jgi:hypothetical protein
MKRFIFYLTIVMFITSCSKEEQENKINGVSVITVGSIQSVYNSKTNSYTAPNFNINDYIVVDSLPESNNTLKVAAGGMIVDTRTLVIGKTGGTIEQYATVPSGYVVTGVGALIKSSSANYASLLLAYRYLYSDGTLGTRYLVRSGQVLNPEQLEAWYEVPSGYVVYGLGVRGKYDVLNMTVQYRKIDTSTVKLTGDILQVNVGLDPNGTNTVFYTPYEQGLDMDRAIIQGIGLNSWKSGSGTETIKVDVGYIKE